jgi:hypothetical protein
MSQTTKGKFLIFLVIWIRVIAESARVEIGVWGELNDGLLRYRGAMAVYCAEFSA